MDIFPSVKRSNAEVRTQLEALVGENVILQGIVVRSEAQIASLKEEISIIKSEVSTVLTTVLRLVDGSSSFNFPAGGASPVKGYRVFPDYGTPANMDTLSPEDKIREVKRKRIADEMYKLAELRGWKTDEKSFGTNYKRFYSLLEKTTGYSPTKPTVFKYIGPQGRKIFTVIEDGYADVLLALIKGEIAKSQGKSRKSSTNRKRQPADAA